MGELTTAALAAADYVLTVLKAGPDEVDGLVELGNTIMDVQETAAAKFPYGFAGGRESAELFLAVGGELVRLGGR